MTTIDDQITMAVAAEVRDWADRRREAFEDMQDAIAECLDDPRPLSLLNMQQGWLSNSFRRMAEDTLACQILLNVATRPFLRGFRTPARVDRQTAYPSAGRTAAPTRAANVPPREASSAAE